MTNGEAHCLVCFAPVLDPEHEHLKNKYSPSSLTSIFSELCSLLNVDLSPPWNDAYLNFEDEIFPFCVYCCSQVIKLCQVSEQVHRLQKEIRSIELQLIATTLESQENVIRSCSSSRSACGKFECFRNSIMQRYSPTLAIENLQVVKSRDVSGNEGGSTLKESIMPWKDDVTTASEFDDFSDPPDFASDDDSELKPVVLVGGDTSDGSKLLEPAPQTPDLKGNVDTDTRAVKLRIVDATTNTYAYGKYEFVHLDNGCQCSTCKKIVSCRDSKKYSRFSNIRRHITSSHIDRIENKALVDASTKTYQMQGLQYQDIGKEFKCLTCGYTCREYQGPKCHRAQAIKRHLRSHLEPDGRTYHCDQCDKRYVNRQSLRDHIRVVHLKVKPEFECGICKTVFVTKDRLNRHALRNHNGPKIIREFPCEHCDKKYTRKDSLKYHINIVHLGVKETFVCDQCGETFIAKDRLTRHMKKAHEDPDPSVDPQPFQCDQCDKKYTHKQTLNEHISTFHLRTEPEAICEHCGASFLTVQRLNNHIKNMHTEQSQSHRLKFHCDQCSKHYVSQRSLRDHINIVHLGLKPFVCDQCGRAFGEKTNLVKHIQTHGPVEKKYKCTQCDKAYARGAALRRHVQSAHLGIRELSNIPCPVCGETFQRKANLRLHQLRIHPFEHPPDEEAEAQQ